MLGVKLKLDECPVNTLWLGPDNGFWTYNTFKTFVLNADACQMLPSSKFPSKLTPAAASRLKHLWSHPACMNTSGSQIGPWVCEAFSQFAAVTLWCVHTRHVYLKLWLGICTSSSSVCMLLGKWACTEKKTEKVYFLLSKIYCTLDWNKKYIQD